MPTYSYNPHQHVKIWLSKNRSSFLNIENQLRLVRMRQINPHDIIHFVYDAELLSPEAQLDLQAFCKKHNISPQNIQSIKASCKTPEETQLLQVYQTEVSSLDTGGNPAVASDILRWLSPVYRLGTYTDFDVDVDTHELAAEISVEQSILMNIGSTTIMHGFDVPSINNDTLAIVDESDALPLIQKIQQSLYKGCSGSITSILCFFLLEIQGQTAVAIHKGYKTLYLNYGFSETLAEQSATVASQSLLSLFYSLDPTINVLTSLAFYASQLKPLETRSKILRDCADNQNFLNSPFNKSRLPWGDFAESLRAQSRAELTFMNWLLMPEQQYNNIKCMANMVNNDELVGKMRTQIKQSFLRSSVIYTSGPGRLAVVLFGSMIHETKVFDDTFLKYSFDTYGLASHFKSKNKIKIHSSPAETAKVMNAELGACNDLSWLEMGESRIQSREQRMLSSSVKIQRLFRDRKATLPARIKKIGLEIEDHIEKINHDLTSCSFYRQHQRAAKVETLGRVFSHFNENDFNVTTFQASLDSYQSHDIAASLTTSKTKGLIDRLTIFARQANTFHVAHTKQEGHDSMVSWTSHPSNVSDL